ncbi:hypothetical protein PAPHI01_2197 [Pancytospora philotis]|nr:hypothetical protein PAPHI01_2197 [Pancytospora philotis]
MGHAAQISQGSRAVSTLHTVFNLYDTHTFAAFFYSRIERLWLLVVKSGAVAVDGEAVTASMLLCNECSIGFDTATVGFKNMREGAGASQTLVDKFLAAHDLRLAEAEVVRLAAPDGAGAQRVDSAVLLGSLRRNRLFREDERGWRLDYQSYIDFLEGRSDPLLDAVKYEFERTVGSQHRTFNVNSIWSNRLFSGGACASVQSPDGELESPAAGNWPYSSRLAFQHRLRMSKQPSMQQEPAEPTQAATNSARAGICNGIAGASGRASPSLECTTSFDSRLFDLFGRRAGEPPISELQILSQPVPSCCDGSDSSDTDGGFNFAEPSDDVQENSKNAVESKAEPEAMPQRAESTPNVPRVPSVQPAENDDACDERVDTAASHTSPAAGAAKPRPYSAETTAQSYTVAASSRSNPAANTPRQCASANGQILYKGTGQVLKSLKDSSCSSLHSESSEVISLPNASLTSLHQLSSMFNTFTICAGGGTRRRCYSTADGSRYVEGYRLAFPPHQSLEPQPSAKILIQAKTGNDNADKSVPKLPMEGKEPSADKGHSCADGPDGASCKTSMSMKKEVFTRAFVSAELSAPNVETLPDWKISRRGSVNLDEHFTGAPGPYNGGGEQAPMALQSFSASRRSRPSRGLSFIADLKKHAPRKRKCAPQSSKRYKFNFVIDLAPKIHRLPSFSCAERPSAVLFYSDCEWSDTEQQRPAGAGKEGGDPLPEQECASDTAADLFGTAKNFRRRAGR